MTSLTSLIPFFTLSLFTIITRAQERAPHGLVYENPMAFSPEAYDFFHPESQQPQSSKGPCSSSDCSTLPEAATVQSTPAHESTSTPDAGRKRMDAGTTVSIPIGLVFALILGLCVFYVVITRRSNAARAKTATGLQPDV